jgi:hypothetical protein
MEKMTFGEFSIKLQSLLGKWGLGHVEDRDAFVGIAYQQYLHPGQKVHPIEFLKNPQRYYEILAMINLKGKYIDYSDFISGVYDQTK